MNAKAKILVVEDAPSEREAITRLLEMESYDVISDADLEHARERTDEPVDLVISDLRIEEADGVHPDGGVELLRHWKEKRPVTPFILLTGHADIDTAVEAMQLGAEDFLTKPVDPKKLLNRIAKHLHSHERPHANGNGNGNGHRRAAATGAQGLIGESTAMRRVLEQAQLAAASDDPVLITGESGVGKHRLAQAIHQWSDVAVGPFIAANLAGLTPQEAERALFGAVDEPRGLIEQAAGGTLFLEELNDLPPAAQGHLLRTLEQGAVRAVGGEESLPLKTRLIVATDYNLERLVRDGKFRHDLYYRLNVLPIKMPPLRDREGDLRPLTEHLLQRHADELHRPAPQLDDELWRFLEQHPWPGNVRQLSNTLHSMLALSREDRLTIDDLPPTVNRQASKLPDFVMPRGATLQDLEEAAVRQTLDRYNGNRTHAADALGISVRTLQRRLKIWGVN